MAGPLQFLAWLTLWRWPRDLQTHASNWPGPPRRGGKHTAAFGMPGPTYLHGVISVGEDVQEVGRRDKVEPRESQSFCL